MLHITKRDTIKLVPKNWEAQYKSISRWSEDKLITYERLQKLNLDTCTEEDITCIIGNSSWTELTCTECGTSVNQVVRLGRKPDWESHTTWVCKDCLEKALALINNSTAKIV